MWFKKYTIEELHVFAKETLGDYIGIEYKEIGDDFLSATMPVDKRTFQPARILHGGASAALAETLGSVASFMCLDFPAQVPVGLELNINHIKSAKSGKVTGICKPIHIGKSTHVWNIEIRNDENELVAISRLTTMVLDNKK